MERAAGPCCTGSRARSRGGGFSRGRSGQRGTRSRVGPTLPRVPLADNDDWDRRRAASTAVQIEHHLMNSASSNASRSLAARSSITASRLYISSMIAGGCDKNQWNYRPFGYRRTLGANPLDLLAERLVHVTIDGHEPGQGPSVSWTMPRKRNPAFSSPRQEAVLACKGARAGPRPVRMPAEDDLLDESTIVGRAHLWPRSVGSPTR